MDKFKRINIDPNKMGGVPCIRNLRMPVSTLISLLADGNSIDDIMNDHQESEREDIYEALRFASEIMKIREAPLAI